MDYYTLDETASLLSVNKETLRRWDTKGKLKASRHPINNYRVYEKTIIDDLRNNNFFVKEENPNYTVPHKKFTSIELFAGAGGLALGLHLSGLNCLLLNEIDLVACQTLKTNMPDWNVVNGDVKNISFKEYNGKVDVLTGGFPCQAFSYAGRKLGFSDTRGTLFYEYARVLDEIRPKIFLAENVRGLLNHDSGRTLSTILSVLKEVGYDVYAPKLLKAIHYNVPQKRERLIIVGKRNDIENDFAYPIANNTIFTLRDALKKGKLFAEDVPNSEGMQYPKRKREILEQVPPGGYWRDLPLNLQKEYMMKSFYLGGGKTGIARRISWDEPSLTLTCSPCQKQTERCHPEETRPFTVREYARIQTFPDYWKFCGSVNNQYRQIGNAVPVNLGKELGYSIIRFLNEYCANKDVDRQTKILA